MKKFIFILLSIILAISIFSTLIIKSIGMSWVIPSITFTSVEDFLYAYLDGFIRKEERLDITELETFYLPVEIPKGFVIRLIIVDEYGMSFLYLPEDIEVTADTLSMTNNLGIQLFVFWYNSEIRMDRALQARNQTIDDLIDNRYSFFHEPNSYILFNWLFDGMFFGLEINLRQQDTEEFKALFGDGDPLEFVKFAETRTVDLTDTEVVLDLINFGERFLRGDVNGDMRVDTADALMILRYSVGLIDEIDYDAADMNRDGKVDTADALIVLRIAVGIR